jgi:hypothetical protein
MELVNHSPYSAGIVVDSNRDGADTLVLIVKASFDILPDGALEFSLKQPEIEWADVFAGEPGASSVLYESDASWGRTGTDVAFIGYAYPRAAGDRHVDVGLRVAHLNKTLRVFGDRHWENTLSGARMSPSAPFERMPIVWERAFGGTDLTPADPKDHRQEARNPVGRGFRAKASRAELDGSPLPNIEHPLRLIQDPSDRPPPVGFGFVAKWWMPRVGFAGTYDERWRKTRAPLLPDDYDPRFTVAASEGLWSPSTFVGGEMVDLIHLTPAGRLRFALPKVDLGGMFLARVPSTELEMRLVVVFIDAVRMRLTLLWQGSRSIHGLIDEIRWVRAFTNGAGHVAH